MTTYYVDSAGSNTAPYDTWAKAANLLATIAAIDVAGDTVYVASTHSETTAGTVTLFWAGTATNPTKIISADKTSGAPPATIAVGAQVATSGANGLNLFASTSAAYFYGITFIAGSGANSASIGGGTGPVLTEQCSFQLGGNAGTISLWAAKNCTFKFNNAVQGFTLSAQTEVIGTLTMLAGGTSPTTLFSSSNSASYRINGLDISQASASINLFSDSSNVGLKRSIVLSAVPSGWSGSLNAVTPAARSLFELMSVDSAGTNYILHRQTQFGDIYSETTIVRSGGATDGTTPLSWKMVSLAASGTFPITVLQTGEFTSRNNNISAPVTVTVEFVHDSLTGLKDNEIWLEIDYYASGSNPQGTLASSAMANVLATPATLTASSAVWTTTGLTNPNTQKMSVTFTPNLKGSFLASVKLAKSAYTVYVDPKMTLTF